ncbi:MAG: hypothetical protein JNK87_25085, partial [Bryobacterales bacterium]|nr:hypothetical protein [Bryobacterales bacterium]
MRVFLALLGCAVSLCATGGRRYPVPQEVGHILAMVQDTQGYLWVGAEGGLFRFDGYRFQPVGDWAGLPREPVKVVVYAHNDGALWMGLPSGLYRLGGARAERIDERPVNDAAWLASGLIAATPGVGLVYWYADQRQWKRVVESISQVPAHVHPTPAFDGITYAQGPALQRATWTGSSLHLTTEPVREAAGEWREAVLREDYLLLGSATEYAIAKRSGGMWRMLSHHAAPVTGKRMIALENAPVTIRGETATLFSNGKQFARQVMSPSVVQPLRHNLFAIYLANSREFLHYSLGNSSVQFGPEFGVREPQAMRLTGGKWLVAGRTGVASIEKDNPDCQRFPFTWTACPWVATKETIHDVRIGVNGQIWALSRETGVVRLDRARGVVERLELPEGIRPAELLLLAEASDGRLFAGSTQGMLALQQSGKARLERVEGFGYTANFSVGVDGTLWAVAEGKIGRYRQGTWTSMPAPGCLLSPQLQSLAVESTQSLWIGYRADLGFTNLLQDTSTGSWRCEHYTAREGFSPIIKWLVIDQLGRLWAGGDRRIVTTQLEAGKRPRTTEDWVSIGATEGLGPGQLLPYGATKQEDGAMWVTTTEGVTLFPHGFLRAAEPLLVSAVERTGG